jgi:hypothetical protein
MSSKTYNDLVFGNIVGIYLGGGPSSSSTDCRKKHKAAGGDPMFLGGKKYQPASLIHLQTRVSQGLVLLSNIKYGEFLRRFSIC